MAVSGDIQKFYYALALVAAGRRCYERHTQALRLSAISSQL